MRRGNLVAYPPPRVHVDWRVVYAPPTGWRGVVWRLAERYRRQGLVAAWLLRPRKEAYRWLEANGGKFVFELVVLGRRGLQEALQSLVLRDRLWVAGIARYDDWAAYARDAGQVPRLIELVVPEGVESPLLDGVDVHAFRGQGHKIGQGL